MIVLKLMGLPDGRPTKFDGWYLKSFDFEAYEGRGNGDWTEDMDEALAFDDLQAAFAFMNTQPECAPLRLDGLPNRPMRATTWQTVIRPEVPSGE